MILRITKFISYDTALHLWSALCMTLPCTSTSALRMTPPCTCGVLYIWHCIAPTERPSCMTPPCTCGVPFVWHCLAPRQVPFVWHRLAHVECSSYMTPPCTYGMPFIYDTALNLHNTTHRILWHHLELIYLIPKTLANHNYTMQMEVSFGISRRKFGPLRHRLTWVLSRLMIRV